MFTIARLADRIAVDVQRVDRPELPEHVADLRRDPDRSGHRRRLGRAIDDRLAELRETADDQTERVDRALSADLHGLDRRVGDRLFEDDTAWLADSERSLSGGDLLGGPQRGRHLARRAVRVLDAERDGLTGVRSQVGHRVGAGERTVGVPVEADDDVARLETGRGRRRTGLDRRRADADRRVTAECDAGEDDEREGDVHQDARDEDEQLEWQTLRREGARVLGVGAVLAFQLHEAADRQVVERVDGLAAVGEDLGARREPDRRTRGRGRWRPGRSRSGRARG